MRSLRSFAAKAFFWADLAAMRGFRAAASLFFIF
jgi:hypothetical protein